MNAIGFPRSYVQGFGIFTDLGKEVKRFGSKAFVLADEFVYNTYKDKIEKTFADSELPFDIFTFKGECSPSQIEKFIAKAKECASTIVVGIGGGKTLDTSKAVSYNLSIPLVIVPTIASNDAPTSRVIATYEDDGTYIGPQFIELNPESIFVDSEIISKAPALFLSCGIADALATYYEAQQCLKKGAVNFYGGKQTLISQAIAKTCNDVIWEYAPQAYEDIKSQKCTEAVEKIIEANILLSGVGFEGCGVAGAHAVGGAMTFLEGEYGDAKRIMHGIAVSLGILVQFALEGRSDEEFAKIHELYSKIGLPIHFSQADVADFSEEKMKFLAGIICRPKSRIWNMAVDINEDVIVAAFKRVQELGKKKLGL